jgi:hypothetical protein
MARPAASGHHRGMNSDASASAYVAASASRLRRAAGELREWAGSPDAVPSLPITLAHVEDALDQIAESMQLMARSIESGHGARGAIAEDNAAGAEAHNLDLQLQLIATSLMDARDACPSACEWARRLVAMAAADRSQSAPASTSWPGPRRVGASDLVPRPRRRALAGVVPHRSAAA